MAIELDSDSLEAKIVKILMEGKPVTISDVADELKVSERRLKRAIKGLASRGIIQLDELPDKTYLRLQRSDIEFKGMNPSQEKKIKHKKKKEEKEKGSKRSKELMYR